MNLNTSLEAASSSATRQHLIKSEGSLQRLKEPRTGPYPKPDQSSPY
jgi:hypothetical protein